MLSDRCIESKKVEIVNGYEITRDIDQHQDRFTEEFSGHKKVWYSVCVPDGDMLDCFKTLELARKYAKSI